MLSYLPMFDVITVLLIVLAGFIIPSIAVVPEYEFDLHLYQKNISWLQCPEGWTNYGITCITVITEKASFEESEINCQSYGGHLIQIDRLNKNRVIGEKSRDAKVVDGVWIGLCRDISGTYHWTDGSHGNWSVGFWLPGQPEITHKDLKLCTYMVISSGADQYRWVLDRCDVKKSFICEIDVCAIRDYRCDNGQCVSAHWRCDGGKDCSDGSDEWNCSPDQCGGFVDEPDLRYPDNRPGTYQPWVNCQWKIRAQIGFKVKLQFSTFDTEPIYDEVRVYDGLSTADTLIGRYSGSNIPPDITSTTNFLLVTFTTDHTVQRTGFTAQWSSVLSPCDSLLETLEADNSIRWITSPGYPDTYSNNLQCSWIIRAAKGEHVTLQIILIDLLQSDWLEIRDGASRESTLIGRYTGHVIHEVLISSGRHFYLHLHTDLQESGAGFNISYHTGCDITLDSGYGRISSPGYHAGKQYPNNLRCTWTLQDTSYRESTLSLEYLHTESSYDTLQIYNSDIISAHSLLLNVSGRHDIIPPLRSETGYFVVHFQTDNLVNKPGWAASFSFDCLDNTTLPENLSSTSFSAEYKSFISYSCDRGYRLEGTSKRYCDMGGVWNSTIPVCKLIHCGAPATLKNGILLNLTSRYYDGVAYYRCNLGHGAADVDYKVTCLEDGWVGMPLCNPVRCPKLKSVPNGIIYSPYLYHINLRADFVCKPGYRIDGHMTTECKHGGQWSHPEPSCVLINYTICEEVKVIHGSVNITGPVSVGETIQVSCNHGYQLVPETRQSMMCNESGHFDKDLPLCEDIDECEDSNLCGPQHTCHNILGSFWCECGQGYQHNTSDNQFCEDINECLTGSCDHGCVNTEGGFNCTCDHNYRLYTGNQTIIVNRRVLVPYQSCYVTCENKVVENSTDLIYTTTALMDGSFLFPTSLHVACPYGSQPDGPTVIQCQEDGTWSYNVTKCVVAQCEDLTDIDYGKVVYTSDRQAGSLVNFTCNLGYNLRGNSTRFCKMEVNSEGHITFKWTGGEPLCEAIDCQTPPSIKNGNVTYVSTKYNNIAIYGCEYGYRLHGQTHRTCLSSGLWSTEIILCVAQTCPPLQTPLSGSLLTNSSIYGLGTTATFTCKAGYQITDLYPIQCEIPEPFKSDIVTTSLPELQFLVSVTVNSPETLDNLQDNCAMKYSEWLDLRLKAIIKSLQLGYRGCQWPGDANQHVFHQNLTINPVNKTTSEVIIVKKVHVYPSHTVLPGPISVEEEGCLKLIDTRYKPYNLLINNIEPCVKTYTSKLEVFEANLVCAEGIPTVHDGVTYCMTVKRAQTSSPEDMDIDTAQELLLDDQEHDINIVISNNQRDLTHKIEPFQTVDLTNKINNTGNTTHYRGDRVDIDKVFSSSLTILEQPLQESNVAEFGDDRRLLPDTDRFEMIVKKQDVITESVSEVLDISTAHRVLPNSDSIESPRIYSKNGPMTFLVNEDETPVLSSIYPSSFLMKSVSVFEEPAVSKPISGINEQFRIANLVSHQTITGSQSSASHTLLETILPNSTLSVTQSNSFQSQTFGVDDQVTMSSKENKEFDTIFGNNSVVVTPLQTVHADSNPHDENIIITELSSFDTKYDITETILPSNSHFENVQSELNIDLDSTSNNNQSSMPKVESSVPSTLPITTAESIETMSLPDTVIEIPTEIQDSISDTLQTGIDESRIHSNQEDTSDMINPSSSVPFIEDVRSDTNHVDKAIKQISNINGSTNETERRIAKSMEANNSYVHDIVTASQTEAVDISKDLSGEAMSTTSPIISSVNEMSDTVESSISLKFMSESTSYLNPYKSDFVTSFYTAYVNDQSLQTQSINLEMASMNTIDVMKIEINGTQAEDILDVIRTATTMESTSKGTTMGYTTSDSTIDYTDSRGASVNVATKTDTLIDHTKSDSSIDESTTSSPIVTQSVFSIQALPNSIVTDDDPQHGNDLTSSMPHVEKILNSVHEIFAISNDSSLNKSTTEDISEAVSTIPGRSEPMTSSYYINNKDHKDPDVKSVLDISLSETSSVFYDDSRSEEVITAPDPNATVLDSLSISQNETIGLQTMSPISVLGQEVSVYNCSCNKTQFLPASFTIQKGPVYMILTKIQLQQPAANSITACAATLRELLRVTVQEFVDGLKLDLLCPDAPNIVLTNTSGSMKIKTNPVSVQVPFILHDNLAPFTSVQKCAGVVLTVLNSTFKASIEKIVEKFNNGCADTPLSLSEEYFTMPVAKELCQDVYEFDTTSNTCIYCGSCTTTAITPLSTTTELFTTLSSMLTTSETSSSDVTTATTDTLSTTSPVYTDSSSTSTTSSPVSSTLSESTTTEGLPTTSTTTTDPTISTVTPPSLDICSSRSDVATDSSTPDLNLTVPQFMYWKSSEVVVDNLDVNCVDIYLQHIEQLLALQELEINNIPKVKEKCMDTGIYVRLINLQLTAVDSQIKIELAFSYTRMMSRLGDFNEGSVSSCLSRVVPLPEYFHLKCLLYSGIIQPTDPLCQVLMLTGVTMTGNRRTTECSAGWTDNAGVCVQDPVTTSSTSTTLTPPPTITSVLTTSPISLDTTTSDFSTHTTSSASSHTTTSDLSIQTTSDLSIQTTTSAVSLDTTTSDLSTQSTSSVSSHTTTSDPSTQATTIQPITDKTTTKTTTDSSFTEKTSVPTTTDPGVKTTTGVSVTMTTTDPGVKTTTGVSVTMTTTDPVIEETTRPGMHECYVCDMDKADSNEDCINSFESCTMENPVCKTEVWYIGKSGQYTLSKGCQSQDQCEISRNAAADLCDRTSSNAYCVYCCNTSKCNYDVEILTFKGRRKRSVDDDSVTRSAQWNATTPFCRDVEPPVFTDCPSNVIKVTNKRLPVHVHIPVSTAIDNSGTEPSISVTPSDFTVPYWVYENTIVTFTATDREGLNSTCVIHIIVQDVLPPVLNCPTDVVKVYTKATQNTTLIDYNEIQKELMAMIDKDDVNRTDLRPKPGESISVLDEVKVNLTVWNHAGNFATCNFIMIYIPTGCPIWTVGSPHNVNITQLSPSSLSVACNVNCTMVHTIDGTHPIVTEYTCQQYAEWTPLHFIPDCVHRDLSICPDWKFNITWIWRPTSFKSLDQECNITDILSNQILAALQQFDIHIYVLHVWNMTENGTIYLYASLNMTTNTSTGPVICPTLTDIQSHLDNLAIPSECEGSAVLTNANISTPTMDCPTGLALVKNNQQDGRCWPCPRGMSAKTAVCESCPLGTYREDLNTTECTPCPANMTTPTNGSMADSDCQAVCRPGSFSATGVVPCVECARGTYQPHSGSKTCLSCQQGFGTVNTGVVAEDQCIEHCHVNEFSETGFKPCLSCPHGYYNNQTQSTECQKCTDKSVMFNTCTGDCGGIQCGDNGHCVSVDVGHICYCLPGFRGEACDVAISQCDNVVCMNDGTCVDIDETFNCNCKTGYRGILCQSVIDPCLSYPCVNGHCITSYDNNSFSCLCFDGFKGKICDIQVDECMDNQCQHGECINLIGHHQCNCTGTGYYGDHCEIQVDHCHDNICMNNGTCINNVEGFTCNCADGFEGPVCDQWMGACELITCQNGGHCVRNITGEPYCVCMSGYSGDICEIDDQVCGDNPCQNGATCVQYPDRAVCQCTQGFTGDLCETVLGFRCQDDPCNHDNSIECVDTETGHLCYCRPGWTGKQCEEREDRCVSNPCLNGGQCENYGTYFICDCLLGYAGHQCEHDVDECHSSPCMNGGVCVDLPSSFECECSQHFTGATCELEVDACQSSPCLHGTCIDSIDGYVCSCDPDWTGMDCDEAINKCVSLPCYNGAICTQNETDFNCTCQPEYTGEFCESEIKPCDPSPCVNGGDCLSENLTFTCLCPYGFYGNQCELVVNACDSLICQNGGTCVEDGVIGRCECTSLYTGVECEKGKSNDFDLTVGGDGKVICVTELVVMDDLGAVTMCLSYKYTPSYKSGQILNLMDDSNVTLVAVHADRIELFLTNDSSVIVVEFGQVDPSWHQVCLVWSVTDGQWSVYFDRILTGQGDSPGIDTIFSKFKISILQDSTQLFQGQITGVNVYSKVMNLDDLDPCNHGNQGDIISWVVFDRCRSENEGFHVSYPSVCPDDLCLPGYTGNNCDQLIDKETPVVQFCPADVVSVISVDELRTVVTWSEPVFVDNVDIVHKNQTYFSGDLFTYGEYQVIYMAFDAEDNHAVCLFHVIVTVRHCRLPSSPINGQHSCDTQSSSLTKCSISCLDPSLYQFTEEPAHLYICREGGVWDPPRGKQFTFPPCAGYSKPYQYYQGEILFNSQTCTEPAKLDLTSKVQQQFYQTGLCQNSDCPTSYITVDCVTINTVKRSTQPVQYKVDFSIPSPSNPTMNLSSIFQSFESFVKGNITRYTVADFTMDIYPQCDLGQVLSQDKLTCVNCGKGYYYSSDARKCELCPLGSYTETERQLSCTSCGDRRTTLSTGSAGEDKCFAICDVGYYLLDGDCEPCEIGYYQDTMGSTQCKPCLLGYTTQNNGSTNISDCYFPCAILGYMMSEDGSCVPCPQGLYKSDRMALTCSLCPSGFTTLTEGAGSVDLCVIVICNPGYKRNDDNECEPCPVGTHQNESGKEFCQRCPNGHTTIETGSTSPQSCIKGEVDECTHQTDNCSLHSVCVDTSDAFLCECILGYTQTPDGTCRDNCLDVCIHGDCNYDTLGNPVCKCHDDYEGLKCDIEQGGLSAGSIIGISVAVVISIVLLAFFVFICLRGVKKRHCVVMGYKKKCGEPFRYASHHKDADRQLLRFPIHRTDLRSSFRAIALAMNPFESSTERTVSSVLRGNARKSKASNNALSDTNSNISSPSKTSYF